MTLADFVYLDYANDFTYPCWNDLIKSLNIVHGETFPRTSNVGKKFVLCFDVSSDCFVVPSLCEAKHFRTRLSPETVLAA